MQLNVEEIQNVLVIKLRAIGDVLLSTIVTKNLRTAFPHARIDFLTERPNRDVLIGNKFIDEIVVFDRSPLNSLKTLVDLRRRDYDLVIDLFGNPRSAMMAVASGAEYRVGYAFRGRRYAYNILVQPRGDSVHNTEFNLDALSSIGVEISDRRIYFPLSLESERFAERFLEEHQLNGQVIIALNPAGGWYTKRWRLERFAELADRMIEKFDTKVVLIWGPGEYQDVQELKSSMRREAIIPPATNLKELGGLLKKCAVLVTNDSGPMHIAAAVGTPVVAIFGPTSPKLQGPYGVHHVIVRNEKLDCLECNLTKCPIGNVCMTELTVDEVMRGVERMLASIRQEEPTDVRA